MSGITVGPRQFTLMKDACITKMSGASPPVPSDFEYAGSGWAWGPIGGSAKYLFNQTKLDLRPYYEANKTRALDILNITLQESPIWANGDNTLGLLVTDIFSTVRLSAATIQRNYEFNISGFLNTSAFATGTDQPDKQRLNPSQVVWGLWRHYDHDANMNRALVVRSSSFFGEGEIVVAPALYWPRIVSHYSASEGATTSIPSANLVCHAAAIDITEGQELSQMSRMAQR